MIVTIDDDNLKSLWVPAAYTPDGPWICEANGFSYRHLIPGRQVWGTMGLCMIDTDRWPLKSAEVKANAYFFRRGEVLLNSILVMELWRNKEMVAAQELDPWAWDENMVIVEHLTSTITDEDVLTLRVAREPGEGEDLIGLLMIRFDVGEPGG